MRRSNVFYREDSVLDMENTPSEGARVPKVLFVNRLREHGDRNAIVTARGERLSYAELADRTEALAAAIAGPARLFIVEFANVLDCVIAYLACLRAGHPVVLVEPGSTERDERTSVTYGASSIFHLADGAWRFDALALARPGTPHPELCVLLSTSGTTGSPKLVRLSRTNIQANAESIAAYLDITPADRAITSLPFYYSYGMSVLNSHLQAGAALLLTEKSVAEAEFWEFFEREGATSLSGVPFTFDLLERIGFRSRHYPALRYLAQAGGRLSAERVALYAQWAKARAKQIFVMYGQTEASPRMAYVPPDQLADNPDCIGVPIPGGSFELIGEDGTPIDGFDRPGELVYRGPNVMMGYAESAEDLAKDSGPNELHTGDLACLRANGNYYITGRKSRFSKILGLRISLDEMERWLHAHGWQGIVSGDDKLVVAAVSRHIDTAEIKRELVRRFALPASAVVVLFLDPIPTLPSNKFDYRQVLRLGHASAHNAEAAPTSLIDGYRTVLGKTDVRPGDSFLDLGGDSVNFVEISLLLEGYLGVVPENWEARSIASLEELKQAVCAVPDAGAGAGGAATVRKNKPGLLAAGLVALGLLVGGEAALQLRAYLITGRVALFEMAMGRPRIVFNEAFGVRTYRPNMPDNDPADDREFTTNSLGFRSPEIAPTPAPGELRIAVVGASTVAGVFAKTNNQTFPGLLEDQLRRGTPGRPINVINAGIEGITMREIDRLVERAIIPLHPSVVLVYAGVNDMELICKASAPAAQPLHPAPALRTVPAWVMTSATISKHALPLRQAPVRAGLVDPAKFFPRSYGELLDKVVTKLKAAGVEPVLLTVARGFDAGDGAVGKELATTALVYNYCLDYDGLVKAANMFNETIVNVAERQHVDLIELGKKMPRGPKYFFDAAHFTSAGEHAASDIIYEDLTGNPLLTERLGSK
jgi:acyl-CoA synthetase (AMP-forming)/AMP-acid ligase II/lysophospholipase L1-like esterase/acyl carrier protein